MTYVGQENDQINSRAYSSDQTGLYSDYGHGERRKLGRSGIALTSNNTIDSVVGTRETGFMLTLHGERIQHTYNSIFSCSALTKYHTRDTAIRTSAAAEKASQIMTAALNFKKSAKAGILRQIYGS